MLSLLITQKVKAQHTTVTIQLFYEELSPHGYWVNNPGYGYVWIPSVGPDFFPYYTSGYWVYTIYGWTWVSHYSWGWAPFHYGRWEYDPYFGWFWIPQTEWAPAWVMWRRSNGYYGWIPLGHDYQHKNTVDNTYYGRRDNWTFVEEKYFGRRDMNKHSAPRTNNEVIINNSSIVTNTYFDKDRNTTYITGPDKTEVEKSSNTNIKQIALKDNEKPGQSVNDEQLTIYRPRVEKNSATERNPAPSKTTDIKEIKPISERSKESTPPVQAQPNEPDRPLQKQPENVSPPIVNPEPPQKIPQPEAKPNVLPAPAQRPEKIIPPTKTPAPEKPIPSPAQPQKNPIPEKAIPPIKQQPAKPPAPLQQPKPVVTPRVNPEGKQNENRSRNPPPQRTQKPPK